MGNGKWEMGNGWEMENRKLKIENYGTLKH